jgi:hypothetical protein
MEDDELQIVVRRRLQMRARPSEPARDSLAIAQDVAHGRAEPIAVIQNVIREEAALLGIIVS